MLRRANVARSIPALMRKLSNSAPCSGVHSGLFMGLGEARAQIFLTNLF